MINLSIFFVATSCCHGFEFLTEDAPPASRILGHEVRERFLPLGQEMYALGDVAWRFRASVKGMNQGVWVGLRMVRCEDTSVMKG